MMGRRSGQMAMVFVDMEALIPDNHLLRKIRWKSALKLSSSCAKPLKRKRKTRVIILIARAFSLAPYLRYTLDS